MEGSVWPPSSVHQSPPQIPYSILGGGKGGTHRKRVRSHSSAWTLLQVLWERVPMWMRLSHPNLLPFRGVNMTLFQLALTYDWAENGNIIQYTASHPEARMALVRMTTATHGERSCR